jgi:hypothetical protein
MNTRLYDFILAILFLIFNIFTFIAPKHMLSSLINLIISWLFLVAYISFLPIFHTKIKYDITNNITHDILYWTGIVIYCIGYLLFAIESTLLYISKYPIFKMKLFWISLITNYKLGVFGGIMFGIGSILLLMSVKKLNIQSIYNNETIYKFLTDNRLLIIYGSLLFLIGSILFIIGYIKNAFIYFQFGLSFFIIGRIYFVYEEYIEYKKS